MEKNNLGLYLAVGAIGISGLSLLMVTQREPGMSEYDLSRKMANLATKDDLSKSAEELNAVAKINDQAAREAKSSLSKRLDAMELESDKEVNTLAATLTDTTEKLGAVRRDITALRMDVEKFSVETAAHTRMFPRSIVLAPTDPGYSILWSSHGPVAISVDEVTPRLSGAWLTIGVINLTGAGLKGFEMDLRWGNIPGGKVKGLDEEGGVRAWTEASSASKVSSDKIIPSGSQVLLTFYLEGYKPSSPGLFHMSELKFATINYQAIR